MRSMPSAPSSRRCLLPGKRAFYPAIEQGKHLCPSKRTSFTTNISHIFLHLLLPHSSSSLHLSKTPPWTHPLLRLRPDTVGVTNATTTTVATKAATKAAGAATHKLVNSSNSLVNGNNSSVASSINVARPAPTRLGVSSFVLCKRMTQQSFGTLSSNSSGHHHRSAYLVPVKIRWECFSAQETGTSMTFRCRVNPAMTDS